MRLPDGYRLYYPTRKSDQMTIGKTHPTLIGRRTHEFWSFFRSLALKRLIASCTLVVSCSTIPLEPKVVWELSISTIGYQHI